VGARALQVDDHHLRRRDPGGAQRPEITVGIFSHTKAIAREFVDQIKRELETNQTLVYLYPDVLWEQPKRQAPRWSVDGGLIVRRKGNPKESTIEGHGLVDGMPTGKHFRLLVYDDVVTEDSVNTPDQVRKTTKMWELSDNLGARDPRTGLIRKWHIGTRYSFADTYQDIIDKDVLKLRVYPATHNGLADGQPVFLSVDAWAAKRATMGPAVLATQMLQNPAAGQQAMFLKDWLRFSDIRPGTLNVYILCDPAHSRKKESDNTAFAVVGVDAAFNKYLLDGARHKMGLKQRWEMLYGLRRVWTAMPGVQMVKIGYERYGMQADLEYFEERMLALKDSFEIIELAWPKDGPGSKEDRVQRLQPDFQAGKFYLSLACIDAKTKQALRDVEPEAPARRGPGLPHLHPGQASRPRGQHLQPERGLPRGIPHVPVLGEEGPDRRHEPHLRHGAGAAGDPGAVNAGARDLRRRRVNRGERTWPPR
jgi:hypothetical protein